MFIYNPVRKRNQKRVEVVFRVIHAVGVGAVYPTEHTLRRLTSQGSLKPPGARCLGYRNGHGVAPEARWEVLNTCPPGALP